MNVHEETVAEKSETASTAADDKQSAKVETKEEATASKEGPGPDTTAETPADQEGDKPKRKGGGFQNRIDRLTREREQARAEASELRKQIEGRNTATALVEDKGDPEPVRPKESDFSDWGKYEEAKEDYIASKAVWKARQEVRTTVREAESRRLAEQATSERRDAVKRFEKAADALSETHEGLSDAIDRFFNDKTMPVSQPMADYIMLVSDRGPEIVNALDADLDEAERISKLSPLAAARELARLEAKLPKPEARKVSNAPPPTTVVKGSAESPTKKMEDMSNAEYMAFRKKQMQAEKNFRPRVTR